MLDHHPRVLAWVKNQGLGFEVPYQDAGAAHVYVPDFIVRIDAGGEPLNLVLEVKGSATMRRRSRLQRSRRCGCRAWMGPVGLR